jgi:hypothetical protein
VKSIIRRSNQQIPGFDIQKFCGIEVENAFMWRAWGVSNVLAENLAAGIDLLF